MFDTYININTKIDDDQEGSLSVPTEPSEQTIEDNGEGMWYYYDKKLTANYLFYEMLV